jgi:hypothetical protein
MKHLVQLGFIVFELMHVVRNVHPLILVHPFFQQGNQHFREGMSGNGGAHRLKSGISAHFTFWRFNGTQTPKLPFINLFGFGIAPIDFVGGIGSSDSGIFGGRTCGFIPGESTW